MNLVQRLKSFCGQRSESSALDTALVNSASAPTESFTLQGDPAAQVRRTHPYLIHVTDLPCAEGIIGRKRLWGCFTGATLAQDLGQCLKQAERRGCALIFEWKGGHEVGERPATLARDVAYHHVGAGGYVETFLAHESRCPLRLVAVAFAGDLQQYSTARVLKEPIKIWVGAEEQRSG